MATHEIVSFIDERMQHTRQDLSRLDMEVERSVRYYLSHQHDAYVPGYPVQPPEPVEGEVRSTINKIAKTVDRKTAKLSATQPIWECLPATAEREDIRNARLMERSLEWAWLVNNMEGLYTDLLWYMQTGPVVFLKAVWEPNAGRSKLVEKRNVDLATGQDLGPLIGEDGGPIYERLYEGMPVIDLVSYWELIFDSVARRFNGMRGPRWAIHVFADHCSRVEEDYGFKPEPERVDPSNRFWRRHRVDDARSGPQDKAKGDELCLVKELWHVPCGKYPEGHRFVVVGDQVLVDEPHPYEDKKLPFVAMCERPIGGSIYGDWVVRRLFDPQDEENIRTAQLREHGDVVSNPPLWAPEELNFHHEMTVGGVGEVWTGNGQMGRPEFLNPGRLSPEVMQSLELTTRQFYEISEIEAMSRDVSADASRVAIVERIEEDESVLGITRQQLQMGLAQTGKLLLSRFHQFMDVPRLIRIAGRDHMLAATRFNKDNVNPDVDVLVRMESATRLSKAHKDAVILQLLTQTEVASVAPDVIPELAEALEVGALKKIFRATSTSKERQLREIERIVETRIPVEPFGPANLGVELQVLGEFLNSVEYELLDELQQMALMQTWQWKSELHAEQQQEQMMQQLAMAQVQADLKGTLAAGGMGAAGKGNKKEGGG